MRNSNGAPLIAPLPGARLLAVTLILVLLAVWLAPAAATPGGHSVANGLSETARDERSASQDEGWAGGFGLPGVNNWVFALAVGPDGLLYAGGRFTTAGGIPASQVARWDGATSSWHPLGSGMNSTTYALASGPDGSLYAGGYFTTAGGIAASRIARWDGITWHPLGSGMNYEVLALAIGPDGSLYAGGSFTTADGAPANHIARWDGATSSWHALDSGTNGSVYALALGPDGSLYALSLIHI